MASVGFEAELHLIDSAGKIAFAADKILKEFEGARRRPVKEMALSIIEINSFPSEIVEGSLLDYIGLIYKVDEVAQEKDLYLLPMALYPGEYAPAYRTDGVYGIKARIFGNERAEKWARCASFHLHYSMPNDKKKAVLLYNTAVALVPVFDLIFQSSPYYNNRFLAKDGRAVLYRDFSYGGVDGAYKDTPFGGYAPYVKDFAELKGQERERFRRLRALYRRVADGPFPFKVAYWGTVRINPKGTIEMRSPDVSLPSVLMDGLKLYHALMERAEACDKWVVDEDNRLYIEDNVLHLPHDPRAMSIDIVIKGFDSSWAMPLLEDIARLVELPDEIKKMREEQKSFADWLMRGEVIDEGTANEIALKAAERMLVEMDSVMARAQEVFADLELFKQPQPFILEWLSEEVQTEPRQNMGDVRKVKVVFFSPLVKRVPRLKRVAVVRIGFKSGDVVVNKENWIKQVAGVIEMWKQAKGLKDNEVAYFGLTAEEAEAIGALFITRLDAEAGARAKADLLVHTPKEIDEFVVG